jgi:hypothetical protein
MYAKLGPDCFINVFLQGLFTKAFFEKWNGIVEDKAYPGLTIDYQNDDHNVKSF